MSFEEFTKDEKSQYAVVRAIEVLGEAIKKIPSDFRSTYSEIPWRDIAGTRDKLIHEYFGVDISVIWKTVKEDLPVLITQLNAILNNFDYFSN